MNKGDSLGDRMKSFYEDRTRFYLPRRTYSIIRLDGKAFHSYTKNCNKPFDLQLINDLNEATLFLCKNIQGAKLAYVQSDEISILLTDFDDIKTSAWFDGNIQKICSISASYLTGKFNSLRPGNLAFFDARVFTIPSKSEVINYFVWRQQDWTRNSIQLAGRTYFSHKQLDNCTCNDIQEMLFNQFKINWNEYDDILKRGRIAYKETTNIDNTLRKQWVINAPPIFSKERELLETIIPSLE